ncbi:hypothetical protein AS593_07545 [Caulobacter vibrioides]|nr:hypothetical protein AS593_07545 [Caulobacter vibrioides]
MLGAIYIGLSGMNAYSKGLQTISNNVANLNTPGFKSTSVSFTDVFQQGGGGLSYLGGGLTHQSGAGVRFGAPSINFGQGDVRQTEGDLDLAIQGSGFLVLLDGDKTFYARTGSFVVGSDGYIVQDGTQNRLAVLDASGQAVPLNLDAKRTSAPTVTTTVKFADNLSSSAGTGGTATDATVSNVTIYDASGGKQVWTLTFKPTTSGGLTTWDITIKDQNGAEIVSSITPLKLRFLSGAVVDPSTEKLTVPGADIVLDFSSNVTNFSGGSTSTIRAASVDGNGVGALTTVSVDDQGRIKLAYSNSKTEELAHIALADFRNPQDLERVGSGLFELKGDDRPPLRRSEQDGVGKLLSKQLEASNVDLSQEFGDLILIQRGFQASSQVVSVSNDMIQQLFGIRGQG